MSSSGAWRLTNMMWFRSSKVIFETLCINCAMPAPFTSVSMPPKYDTDFSIHCSQASGVERSKVKHNAELNNNRINNHKW